MDEEMRSLTEPNGRTKKIKTGRLLNRTKGEEAEEKEEDLSSSKKGRLSPQLLLYIISFP